MVRPAGLPVKPVSDHLHDEFVFDCVHLVFSAPPILWTLTGISEGLP
jgi:hypothetical protein